MPKDSRTCSVNQYLRELARSQWAPRLPGSAAGLPWWLIIPVSAHCQLILKYSMGQLPARQCFKDRTSEGPIFQTIVFSYLQRPWIHDPQSLNVLQSVHSGPAVLVSLSSVHLSWISPDIVHLVQVDLSYVLEGVTRHNVINPARVAYCCGCFVAGSQQGGWRGGRGGFCPIRLTCVYHILHSPLGWSPQL